MSYLLLPKFVRAFHVYRDICTKDNLFILDNEMFDGFFKLLLCFHTVLMGVYSNPLLSLTMSSCSFIFLLPSSRLQKYFFLLTSPFTPQNIHHHLNHSICYIACFLHQYIYTLQNMPGMVVFTLFVYRSIFNTAAALQYMPYETPRL